MAILNEDDLPLFAPGVNLTSDALTGAFYYLQSILESEAGAGRPLDLALRTETRKLNFKTQSFFLQHFPILIDDDHPLALSVRIGGNVVDTFNRAVPPGSWRSLADDEFILDSNNQVFLNYSNINLTSSGWQSSYLHGGYQQGGFTDYKCEYWAGFDFTQDTQEINQLKASAGAILTYIVQSGVFKGVSELNVPFDEFRIKYATDPTLIGQIPDYMMLPFKSLRIRGV
jgi:hypothetical protein